MFYSCPMGNSTTLRIGDRVPDFTLTAANHPGTFTLADLRKPGPVIVEFLRGTWCPNCNKRMAHLETLREQIEGHGATLVYVAAEKRTGIFHPEDYLRQHPVSSPFLLD